MTLRTREGFDKQSWISEADRHLQSARILRDVRRRRRAAVNKASERGSRIRHIRAMEAAVHSSMLLVAYSLELFLKAGLTRIYIGCPKDLFQREVKKRYGHDLVKIARAIDYPRSEVTTKHLREAEKTILSEGRYPFLSEDSESHIRRTNRRAAKFWNDQRFRELVALAKSIRGHVEMLDGDEGNPAWFCPLQIDDDGYFAFRYGGNLSPRIIVRYSTTQRARRENNKRALRRLILRNRQDPLLKHYWDQAKYRSVKV